MKLKTIKKDQYLSSYKERERWLEEYPLWAMKKRKGKKIPDHFRGFKKDNTQTSYNKDYVKRSRKRSEKAKAMKEAKEQ